ncbi:restriction endonuclease subunit S [Rubellimicrobium sp. CFH 75288]|uniref:restriction endonuclease subunit S n=1 Tax=Rubellimicrobium sp. CFH 75288 TaxID=2697034 RepID=UPI001413705D|nr:restriction endonuclease subunit S [Rubellimicrobium sp. CFH 75288]NAZ35198.1 restriction endonuclease subunit S [Rubellimicrobium sp. CFH 75288]
MRLAQLSDIRSGYTARGRLDPLRDGGVPALQLRDIATSGEAPGPDFQRYDLGQLPDRYFVRGGEVVFRSRGEPNTAAAIPDPLPEPVAVIVPLVILRPDRRRVLPDYLAWAINQPDAQRRLGAEAQGTSLRMIPMAVLENLEIAVPDLPTQRRIVELDALARREAQLLRRLAARREHLFSLILGEAARAADRKETAR